MRYVFVSLAASELILTREYNSGVTYASMGVISWSYVIIVALPHANRVSQALEISQTHSYRGSTHSSVSGVPIRNLFSM